jgi:adenosylhomocysteine nucleosidase
MRLAAVGLGAVFLDSRWPALVSSSDHPLVVSAGLCGGLDPALKNGDLVLPDSVVDGEGRRLPVTGLAERRAMASGLEGATPGVLATARAAVATPAAKASLRAATGAVAVDMESARILEIAAAHGCASVVVRAVSDDARESLPAELIGLVEPNGRLRLRAISSLAKPRVLVRALQLRRTTRRALAGVAASLARLPA